MKIKRTKSSLQWLKRKLPICRSFVLCIRLHREISAWQLWLSKWVNEVQRLVKYTSLTCAVKFQDAMLHLERYCLIFKLQKGWKSMRWYWKQNKNLKKNNAEKLQKPQSVQERKVLQPPKNREKKVKVRQIGRLRKNRLVKSSPREAAAEHPKKKKSTKERKINFITKFR